MNYVSSVTTLENLYKGNIELEENLQKQLRNIIDRRFHLFNESSGLRNNIFHYRITGVPDYVFDGDSVHFKTMIKNSIGMSFEKFIEEVDIEIDKIRTIVTNLTV